MDIVDCKLPYHPVFRFSCLKNCINQILFYYGVENSLFYLNCIPDIVYQRCLRPNDKYRIAYQSNLFPILPQYCNRLQRFLYRESDAEKAWHDILERVREGYPVITMVDTYELNYRNNDFGKNHGSHAIIVHGYDCTRNEVKIIDWYEPFFYTGVIPKEEFMKARNSKNPYSNNPFSGHSLENEWFYLEKDGWVEEHHKLLFDTLTLYKAYNCHDRNHKNQTTFIGITALEKIFENLMCAPLPQKEELEKIRNEVYTEYKSKHLFLYYLKEYKKKHSASFLENIIETLAKLCMDWEAVNTLLIKTIVTKAIVYFDKAKSRLAKLLEQERHLLCIITETCNMVY